MLNRATRSASILAMIGCMLSGAGCGTEDRDVAVPDGERAFASETIAPGKTRQVEPVVNDAAFPEAVSADLDLYPHVESRWLTIQKSRARSMLGERRYDVLVVPFQVRGHGFDATGRSLMTLSLANAIAGTTTLSVADPVLVAKAMGLTARQSSDEEIGGIARELGVDTVLIGDVGHNRKGRFRVRMRIARPGRSSAGGIEDIGTFESDDLAFDDTKLPYLSFLEIRDDMVRRVASETRDKALDRREPELVDLPADIAALARSSVESPLLAAHYLQFLGILAPRYVPERTRDLLFERSLVLLEDIDPRSTDYRLLRSRALLYLNRRPAALAALGQPETAAERAFLQLLNGDSPRLTEQARKIDMPLLAMIAGLESERLRMDYGGAMNDELLEALFDTHDIWGPLLYRAYSDNNSWRPFTHIPLKMALDAGAPNKKLSLDAYSAGKIATADSFDEYDVAQLIFRHLHAIEDAAAESRPDSPMPIGPRTEDFADVVRNMLVGDVYQRIMHIYGAIGKARPAMEFGDRYEPLLADHPSLTYVRSMALRYQLADSVEPEKTNLERKYLALGRQSLLWTGGVNENTAQIAAYPGWFMPEYVKFPEDTMLQLTFASDWPAPATLLHTGGDEGRRASYRHCLDYTISNFQCFMDLHSGYWHSQESKDAAEALVDEIADRFAGHPDRLDYLARHLLESGDVEASERMYYDAIEAGTTSWMPYERIGRKLILESRFDDALEVVERYPGFHDSSIADQVTLSNYAYDIGSLMYWAGAYESAAPLYERAASFRTGSGASMASAVRLALIRGDYETAIGETLRRVQRYQSEYGTRDLMGLAVILGNPEGAWAIVEGSLDRLDKPEIWTGVLIVHRAGDAELTEIVDWAFADGRDDIDSAGAAPALRYAFLAHTIDRIPASSLVELLRSRDPRPRPVYGSYGSLSDAGRHVPKPKYFESRVGTQVPNEPQTKVQVDRLLPFAARALVAIENKDYRTAFDSLDEASNYYDLGEFLPYYAWAAAKVGDTKRIEKYLENSMREKGSRRQRATASSDIYFDDYLARAFLHGANGEHGQAIEMLRRSNSDILQNHSRHVFTRYQIIETARLLHLDTGDDRYRDFALDLARRNAIIEPIQAYTHSFVVMLSPDRAERITALARVLTLDPQSRCLATAKDSELDAARELAKDGYPMPKDDSRHGV